LKDREWKIETADRIGTVQKQQQQQQRRTALLCSPDAVEEENKHMLR
jgi:hypothetical protein